MKLKKFFKRFYFEKILGFRPMTVVLRHKISDDQEKYLQNHKYFINLQNLKFWEKKNSDKQIFLEIGFGSGEHLLLLTEENKNKENFSVLGIELYEPGVIKVLKKVDENSLQNLYVSDCDARDVLEKFSKNSLSKIFVLFPDPWTKKRQFNRRLINENFLKICLQKLKNGKEIVLATDWRNYAEGIEKILENLKEKNKIEFVKFGEIGESCLEFKNIYETNFAKRAKREGRKINIFVIKKIS